MKTYRKFTALIVIMGTVFFFAGCEIGQRYAETEEEEQTIKSDDSEHMIPEFQKAIAVLYPTKGNEVFGTVTFTKEDDMIKIVADVSGLSEGLHGFHIHEYGDCSAPDGASAGGHFAPHGNKHGAPSDEERHVGDLGNLDADADGNAHLEWEDSVINFTGENSIIGRAVIVHAGEDDLTSQPTGAAGPRVACGVIGIAK